MTKKSLLSRFSRFFTRSNTGYSEAGASTRKRALIGFKAISSSPSEDIDFNNATLRQRGRMLFMSSPIAAAAINTNRTKIVGPGLHVNCSPNRELLHLSAKEADEWAKKTEAEFELWAQRKENCDALGMGDFCDLQSIVVRSWLMSGDVFVLLKRSEATPTNPYTLRLHIIEADRVSTPANCVKTFPSITEGENPNNGNKIYDGVEVNSEGKAIAYHISSAYPNQFCHEDNEWVRVESVGTETRMPNIIHIMDAERPDQYRGVTYLAPVIEMMLQLRRYTESELIAALIQSYFTAWITTNSLNADEFPFGEVGESGDIENEREGVSNSNSEYEMGPGAVNVLNNGEDIKFGNPNIPVAGFEAFVKSICKMTGAALEIPYDVLLKEFNASYSASKGALEEAWEAIKMRRKILISDFCQTVYETWLAEAVATGRIKAPGFFENPLVRAAWCGTRWDGPTQTHLNPLVEAKANELLVSHGWKSNAQVARESYGGNWKENMEAIAQENKLIKAVVNDREGEGK